MSVFLDTSVLVAGLIDLGPQSAAPHLLLHAVAERRVAPASTAWHCCLEFFSVTTRLPAEFRLTPMDALRASLPAGTLSGAPKIRAMQIIDELEPVKRGPYGGAVGYLSYTGDLDTCIYIRSAVVKDGRVHVQAGGGIVADSEAGYEVAETEAKASAVWSAVELACAQTDWP